MSQHNPTPDRREFLAAAAALTAGCLAHPLDAQEPADKPARAFEPIRIPAWVDDITRMTFVGSNDIPRAVRAGAQVVHTNLIWPYYPLRRDKGGLHQDDDKKMRALVDECHKAGLKLGLGLPPFSPVALVKEHLDWRVHPDDSGTVLKVVPVEDNLGTRLGCNVGPWGDYLIEVCGELVEDYKVDGFSFDGNYHPSICYCPSCKKAYLKDRACPLPVKANLDDAAYREYLVWRGERLEDHYRRLQQRIKKADRPPRKATSCYRWCRRVGTNRRCPERCFGQWAKDAPRSFRWEPAGQVLEAKRSGKQSRGSRS